MDNSPLFGAREDSRLFDESGRKTATDLYAFVSGDNPGLRGKPARAAWELENTAASLGWPTGQIVGSEQSLTQKLGVSRETFREAVRMVELRGSMRMRRGRFGGLGVTQPDVMQSAAALATYLRAIGCTLEQTMKASRKLDAILSLAASANSQAFDGQPGESIRARLGRASGDGLLRLYAATTDILFSSYAADASDDRSGAAVAAFECRLARIIKSGDGAAIKAEASSLADFSLRVQLPAASRMSPLNVARAAVIAMRLLDAALISSGAVARLGSEWDLATTQGTSRPIIRQALRILADFDMLETRRGRNGGVFLKRPSHVGIVRQIYPYIAGDRRSPASLRALIEDLNLAHLWLAVDALAAVSPARREAKCRRIERRGASGMEPRRWISLMQELGRLADAPMIDTLLRCIVTYEMRLRRAVPPAPPSLLARVAEEERAMIDALRRADGPAAEAAQRRGQIEINRFMSETNGRGELGFYTN